MKKRNSFRNWLPLMIGGMGVLGGLVARSYQASGHARSMLGMTLSLILLVMLAVGLKRFLLTH